MRQPRLALHDGGSTIAESSELVLVDGIPATAATTTAAISSSATTATSTSASATRVATTRATAAAAGQNDAARDQHALVGKILRITSTGGIPAGQSVPGAGTARCNVTGPHDCRQRSARRRSPGACGTRSGSRSIRTPPARASSSTTSAGRLGGGRTRGRPAPTTAGTSARGRVRTARRRTAARQPAGMTNPIYAYSHCAVRLPCDHRRRVRPERGLAAAPTTAPTSTATTRAARSSRLVAERQRRLSRAPSSRPASGRSST